MKNVLLDALEDRYQAIISEADATIKIYLEHPVGIGEHSDITGAIGEELDKIARYHDQIEVVNKYFHK